MKKLFYFLCVIGIFILSSVYGFSQTSEKDIFLQKYTGLYKIILIIDTESGKVISSPFNEEIRISPLLNSFIKITSEYIDNDYSCLYITEVKKLQETNQFGYVLYSCHVMSPYNIHIQGYVTVQQVPSSTMEETILFTLYVYNPETKEYEKKYGIGGIRIQDIDLQEQEKKLENLLKDLNQNSNTREYGK